MSGTLVLVRHGQSDWNLKNLFTGWRDPELTPLGIQEAETGGQALAETGIKFDIAFTSALKRAQDTLKIVLDKVGQPGLETIRDERSTSAITAIFPASTRMTPAKSGARNRCISGAAPMTYRRRAAKACAIPAPASGPIT